MEVGATAGHHVYEPSKYDRQDGRKNHGRTRRNQEFNAVSIQKRADH